MAKPQCYYALKPQELVESAIEWMGAGYQVAILTLSAIEGSAPYPVGTQMLVRDDGKYEGQLTGGCVESSLVEQALGVIQSQQNITERYGLGSRFFDIKLPCGSGIDVQFDVQSKIEDYQKIASSLVNRHAVTVSDIKTYYPNRRIMLFGEGLIVGALIKLATQSGFDVMHFESGQQYDLPQFYDQYTGLVSLFHEHDLEIDILLSAVRSELFYIGALGSQKTQAARLQNLVSEGVDAELLDKIHGPIGLDIGAVTPSQIAVSIVAEIISVMNHHAN